MKCSVTRTSKNELCKGGKPYNTCCRDCNKLAECTEKNQICEYLKIMQNCEHEVVK